MSRLIEVSSGNLITVKISSYVYNLYLVQKSNFSHQRYLRYNHMNVICLLYIVLLFIQVLKMFLNYLIS